MFRIPTHTEQSSVVTILVYHFLIEGYPRWQTGLVKQDFLNSDIFLVCTLQERQIIRNLIGKAETSFIVKFHNSQQSSRSFG